MTVEELLQIEGLPRLDSEVLLSFTLNKPRSWLYGHSTDTVSDTDRKTYVSYIERRKTHEPVAYITGRKEFYGREFMVNTDVLIPRPATEQLVQSTLDVLRGKHTETKEADTDIVIGYKELGKTEHVSLIVDVGTGSGCVGITLALEEPSIRCIATDISPAALSVGKQNANRLQVPGNRIRFCVADALEDSLEIQEDFLLVSNPPYIPATESVMSDVADYEPHLALFAGAKGEDVLLPLWHAAHKHPYCKGILFECKKDQWQRLLNTNTI